MTVFDRLDATHDPKVRSWLAAANSSGCAFPIQNLPFGVFRRARSSEPFRGGVAIGDQIIDLAALAQKDLFTADAAEAVRLGGLPSLNSLMQLGPQGSSALRHALFDALKQGSVHEGALRDCLVAQADAAFSLPVGATSAPVKSPFGWHIINVEEKKPATKATLASTRAQIKDTLTQQQQQQQIPVFLQGLRAKANIQVYDDRLKDAFPPPLPAPASAAPAASAAAPAPAKT